MGYHTKHAIRIINNYNTRSNLKKLNRVIKLVSEYSFDIKGSTLVDFSSLDYCGFKWYEYENDMRIVSKLLPKYVEKEKVLQMNGVIFLKMGM